jgi:hypothetical protein
MTKIKQSIDVTLLSLSDISIDQLHELDVFIESHHIQLSNQQFYKQSLITFIKQYDEYLIRLSEMYHPLNGPLEYLAKFIQSQGIELVGGKDSQTEQRQQQQQQQIEIDAHSDDESSVVGRLSFSSR